MKIYDISMVISEEMMVYNNLESKKPSFVVSADFDRNSHYETDVTMNMHTGTHIDAPLHMIQGGSTMDCYSIEDYVTEAKVIDLTHCDEMISKVDLENSDIARGDFVLLKTNNSYCNTFNNKFVFLEKEGAQFLCELGIKGIGTDGLGIERSQPNHETHKTLFGNKIMIVEGLDLKEVEQGTYQLIVLPLKIIHTEAAPARAILIKN